MAKKLRQNQKIRVIVHGDSVTGNYSGTVAFYSTAKQIRDGVGDHMLFNDSVRDCLAQIEREDILGLSATFGVFRVQLSVIEAA